MLQLVATDVLFEKAKNIRVRFEPNNTSCRINTLKVENGHSDVTASINNERVRPLRFEMVNALNKLVIALHVKVKAISNSYLIVEVFDERSRFQARILIPKPREQQQAFEGSCVIHQLSEKLTCTQCLCS